MSFPRVIVAGTQSGVGKTTVACGLMGALRRRGLRTQPFKVGPDFLDPTHHQTVSGMPSRNLDTWLLGDEVVRELFCRAALLMDLSVIEGVMGLFDGAGTLDEGSTADLARALQAPVLLVLDTTAMGRSAAAVVQGFRDADPHVRLAGVILNRVASPRHEKILRDAITGRTGLPVLGALPRCIAIEIPHRHLGLLAGHEQGGAHEKMIELLTERIDLDRVVDLASSAPPLEAPVATCFASHDEPSEIRCTIAYAWDEAFYFYYRDNLDMLRHLGCELIPFSPIHDPTPPAADLLYIGGGYPELHAGALRENRSMRAAIREWSFMGGPIYAECGGLMYLCERLVTREGDGHQMCGVYPAEAIMETRARRLGYTAVRLTDECLVGAVGTEMRGHQFHYSTLRWASPVPAVYTTTRLDGVQERDGFKVNQVLAGYTHLHFGSHPELARHLIRVLRQRVGAASITLPNGRKLCRS